MARLPMTRELARHAGFLAADQSARRAGRKAWSRADYNRAVREMHRLWPMRLERSVPYEERTHTTTLLKARS